MSNLFLTNDTDQTFLARVCEDLRRCNTFCFSVSFIKKAGLILLKKDIEAALARGCRGKIITSTYQNFTDVESLKIFTLLAEAYPNNFECHLDFNCFVGKDSSIRGYHSKGYLFTFEDGCELIIGSSNITRYALLKNIEWDLLIKNDREVFNQAMEEFEVRWQGTKPLDYEIIQMYANQLNYAIERWDMDYNVADSTIKPNYMQRTALKELNRYRAMGIGRAIAVCSAGSGKTYLSAFDAFNFNPKRLLYIAHESSILKSALDSFQRIFGADIYFGLYTGEIKERDADFLFSTNVLMSRDLELFPKDYFDYIIVDECHHAVADSYKKIINYFQPEFLLGLTATPERMDNKDVLELFDRNVPYELRLRDAIINDLVVPFHYYGVRDQIVDYSLTKGQERKMLAQIADEEHCKFVISQIEKYRPEGKLKALVFCRNITHARIMSEVLGEHYNTQYLTGKNTVGERIRAYNDLQNDAAELEMLCSVDILNEGVDIPGVNMVIFLRPTDSSTIFIQQLGRGLRKYSNKPYVTVLDFIGNDYKRSVQIAVALGSLAKNLVLEKRLMQALVRDNFEALGLNEYGVKIELDDLSKTEIIRYLESENFNSQLYLKQDYENFKKYISSNGAPKHIDYLNNDCAPDLQRFMSIKIGGKKTACYYNFLADIGETNLPIFSEKQINFLKYVSSLLPLVRPHEYLVLFKLLEAPATKDELRSALEQSVVDFDEATLMHALTFMRSKGAVLLQDDEYILNIEIDCEFTEHLKDLIEYGLVKYNAEYDVGQEFILWHSYGMGQVQLKLLKNPDYNQKGTYIYGNKVVIFASLKKDASIEERLNYKDKYLTPQLFQWESENNIRQTDVDALNNSDFAYVFVRKVSEEHGIVLPFTYVGKGKLTNPRRQEKLDASNGKTGITYLYDIEMEEELPDYLQYDFGLNN